MKSGESKRFGCTQCGRKIEVTLLEDESSHDGIEGFCPFCQSPNVTEEGSPRSGKSRKQQVEDAARTGYESLYKDSAE